MSCINCKKESFSTYKIGDYLICDECLAATAIYRNLKVNHDKLESKIIKLEGQVEAWKEITKELIDKIRY